MTDRRDWRAMGLDLVSLRVFVAAADEGSLAKAAVRENIAVSAVSRRISELEGRTGVQLFDRRGRGVLLTLAGAQLLEQVRDLFNLLERIALDLESTRGGARGLVRVQAHMSAASHGLPEVVAAFAAANPGIAVEIEENTSLDVLHAVRTGMVDVGLVSGTVDPDSLQLIPWACDELVAVLPAGHMLAAQPSVQFSELLSHPFVGMQRDSALLGLYRKHATALGRELRVSAYAGSFESVRKLVSVGLGLAILPRRTVEHTLEALNLEVRSLNESWATRPLMVCVRDLDRVSAATRFFVTYIVGRSRMSDMAGAATR